MKKILYLVSFALVTNVFIGCNPAPKDGTTTTNGTTGSGTATVTPTPLTPEEKVAADLKTLKDDLTALSSSSVCATITDSGDSINIYNKRKDLQTQFKLTPCADGHFGILCLNDIISMLIDTKTPGTLNNAIVVYPTYDKSQPDPLGIVCRGTLYTKTTKGYTLGFNLNPSYYTPSIWCPSQCQDSNTCK